MEYLRPKGELIITHEVELIKINKKPYFVSNNFNFKSVQEEQLFIFKINNKLVCGCFDDFLGPQIEWVKPVIATPEEIGFIYKEENDKENGKTEIIMKILPKDISQFIRNKTILKVEIQSYKINENKEVLKPRMIHGKVLVHLE